MVLCCFGPERYDKRASPRSIGVNNCLLQSTPHKCTVLLSSRNEHCNTFFCTVVRIYSANNTISQKHQCIENEHSNTWRVCCNVFFFHAQNTSRKVCQDHILSCIRHNLRRKFRTLAYVRARTFYAHSKLNGGNYTEIILCRCALQM